MDRPVVQFVDRPGVLDLGWGHPHPDRLPVEGWAAATGQSLRRYGWQALTYGYGRGPGPLIGWLAEHLAEPDRGTTFITAGASHALELVSQVLTRPGDVVLVDAPTYHLALRVLADRGVDLVAVPTDADGLVIPALVEQVAALRRAGRRVPMLYLVPTFGNPTGRSLPDQRRAELVELAARHEVTVVEDDTYRELVFEGPAPESLWRRAGGRGVVRLGSFAKTVAPGLRLGWINAEPALIDRLADLGYVDSGGGVNHTNALTMACFGDSGAYAEHLAAIRAGYAGQRDALVTALRAGLPELAVPSPAGGWFVWLRLPDGMSAAALAPVAEAHGVSFVDGRTFYVGPTGGTDHVRLSYSLHEPADLATAATRLAAAIRATGTGDD